VLVGLYETFQKMVLDARTRVVIYQQLEKSRELRDFLEY